MMGPVNPWWNCGWWGLGGGGGATIIMPGDVGTAEAAATDSSSVEAMLQLRLMDMSAAADGPALLQISSWAHASSYVEKEATLQKSQIH